MIRRRCERRADDAFGDDAGRPFKPRTRIGKMLFPIGAIEFFRIGRVWIEDEWMSRHECLL